MRELTKAQRSLLSLLAAGPRMDISDERTVLALERRGFAERLDGLYGRWRITPAGLATLRARLEEHREGGK